MSFLGLVIILAILAAGLLAPQLAPHDPIKIDLSRRLLPPQMALHIPPKITFSQRPQLLWGDFPLGTDHLGRCILSRLLYGTQVSLRTSFLALVIIMSVGVFVGILSGYVGGKLDSVVVSIIDVLLAFPGLILALAIAGMLGPSITNVMVSLAAVHWVGYARIIRGMVVSIKEKEYVLAARSCGTSEAGIVFRHILPNVLSPVIVLATLDMGSIILSISGLSFLGLGAQPPMPEWGAMLNDGRAYMQVAPWLMIFPGLAILLSVLAFNLMGDGLRDIFDPRGIRRI